MTEDEEAAVERLASRLPPALGHSAILDLDPATLARIAEPLTRWLREPHTEPGCPACEAFDRALEPFAISRRWTSEERRYLALPKTD